jgi:hypothetical protein
VPRPNHVARGWRFVSRMLKTAAKPTACRLWVAVTLALMFGGADRLLQARAAAAGDARVSIYLSAWKVGGEHTICVGDKVQIRVSVMERVRPAEGYTQLVPVIGAQIGASVDGSGVGRISPEHAVSNLGSDAVGAALFTFSALRSGTATVTFQGTVAQRRFLGLELGGNTVTTSMTLQVEDCVYRVTAMSRFSAQDVDLLATMDGSMKREADGYLSGSAVVNWGRAVTIARDCSGEIEVAPSTAELFAKEFDNRMIVDVRYLPAALTHSFSCGGRGSTNRASVTPKPLAFDVSENGDVLRKPHDLDEPKTYSMHGSVVFIVTRSNRR